MKYIILTLILISSCTSDRLCRKAERKGCQRDTIKIEITKVVGEKQLYLDSNKLDSAVNAILSLLNNQDDTIHDTTYLKSPQSKLKGKIKDIIKTIPCQMDSVNENTEFYDLRIWVENGVLKYEVNPKIVKEPIQCPELKWYQRYWMFWFVIGAMVMFYFIYVIPHKYYIKNK